MKAFMEMTIEQDRARKKLIEENKKLKAENSKLRKALSKEFKDGQISGIDSLIADLTNETFYHANGGVAIKVISWEVFMLACKRTKGETDNENI